jgi:hypothetical protein
MINIFIALRNKSFIKSTMKIFLLTILFLIPQIIFAQDDTLKKEYKLSVTSNIQEAKIFIDSIFIGDAPIFDLRFEEGIFDITVVNSSEKNNWKNENVMFKQFHLQSDTTIHADFNFLYFIRSDPFNASVFHNENLLGKTPLRYFNSEKLNGSFILKKPGYHDHVLDLTFYNFETGADVNLKPKNNLSNEEIVFKNRDTRFNTKRNFIPVISFGAAALASAYGTIHFKNVANDSYDRYLSDPVLYNSDLNKSNKNDIYSMVSLGLMQVALAGVVYYLFLD